MKFGKEFALQMVPEWKEAYMGYEKLKALVAEIQRFKQRNTQPPMTQKRKQSLYRAFSGLISHKHSRPTSPSTPGKDIENQVILMNSIKRDDDSESYETMFLMAADEGGDLELVYFRRLDVEFNKVVQFYKSKVDEVMKEAVALNKQMDALIALRIKVEDPEKWLQNSASTSSLSASRARSSRVVCNMDVIEDGLSSQEQSDKSSSDKEADETEIINENPNNTRAPLDILERTKTYDAFATPCLNIQGILNVPKEIELQLSRYNLKRVEEQLKCAFIQFYHKLRHLKSYSFLNMLAFSKIMKKYDKKTSRNASKPYLKMVDNSYLGSSDEVNKLMDRVEATYIKHFSNSNRQKGMNILRPKAKKERHRVTFSLGFCAGCTVALILALVLIIHAHNILDQIRGNQYMENMFPLYSLFAFVVLHMIMYAANIYFWRRYRVNYSFIFGFKQGTELGSREVLFFSFGLAVLALASVLSNLDMEMDPKTLDYKAYTELLPLGVVVIVSVILICPFNILYRSSRFFFITSIFHCICAPLYKVTFPDFFLADQLTSQVQAIRSLQFYICYYGWGDYKRRQNNCKTNDVFNTLYFIVAVIPYWSRLLQCLRRLYEERDAMQGYNGLKYLSTIVAVSMRTAYSLDNGMRWKILAWVSSAIAAFYSTYWDLVVDWGLLQRHSKNPGLRDKLILPYKSVYFGAMVLNVLLRFAWLQTVLNLRVSFLHRETLIAIVASLEIIRRGMWSFFRLENEHLNNVGKFRAFKSVPLPFNYDEDEKQR